MKRLYEVQISTSVMVIADNDVHAEKIVCDDIHEIMRLEEFDVNSSFRPVLGVPQDWADSIPYGDAEDFTCRHWLTKFAEEDAAPSGETEVQSQT